MSLHGQDTKHRQSVANVLHQLVMDENKKNKASGLGLGLGLLFGSGN